MKFFLASLIALALASTTVMARLPEPAPAAAEATYYTDSLDKRVLEKRTITGTVRADNLEAYTCPQLTCTSVNHYHKGDHIDMICYTETNTTVIDGDAGWAKLTDGHYVPLANSTYVGWDGQFPPC